MTEKDNATVDVVKLKELIKKLRSCGDGAAPGDVLRFDYVQFSNLCDDLESCIQEKAPAPAQGSAADLGRSMGAAAAGLLGLLPHAAQGQPVTVNVYVTTNGK